MRLAAQLGDPFEAAMCGSPAGYLHRRGPHGRTQARRNAMKATEEQAVNEHVAPVEAWDAIAEGYDQYVAPGEAQLANEALDLAGLRQGERFLDVAAGTGGLSLPAARRGANVLATDWSAAMIARFNTRSRAEGLVAEGRLMDCHRLDVEDNSFDIAGS